MFQFIIIFHLSLISNYLFFISHLISQLISHLISLSLLIEKMWIISWFWKWKWDGWCDKYKMVVFIIIIIISSFPLFISYQWSNIIVECESRKFIRFVLWPPSLREIYKFYFYSLFSLLSLSNKNIIFSHLIFIINHFNIIKNHLIFHLSICVCCFYNRIWF